MGATGMLSIALGAILYWVVDVNLPGVDNHALGVILIVAGVVALAVSLVARSQFGNPGIGSGIGLFAAGAILYWALDIHVKHVDNQSLAVILMVAGGLMAAVSWLVTSPYLQEAVAAGVFMMAVGAALYWAIQLTIPHVNDHALAVILMVVGALGTCTAIGTHLRQSGRPRRRPGSGTPDVQNWGGS